MAHIPILTMLGKRLTQRDCIVWCISMLDAGLLFHLDDDVKDIIFDKADVSDADRAVIAKQVENAFTGNFDPHHCCIVAIRYRQRFPKREV